MPLTSTNEAPGVASESETFFAQLNTQVRQHRALGHPFLARFAETKLQSAQLVAFAMQHYLYSRQFNPNLAAAISNVPDEVPRTILIVNMYEEIGEPLNVRDRMHLLLLEAGLVKPSDVGDACAYAAAKGVHGDVAHVLIERGLATRNDVRRLAEADAIRAKDMAHPALFRRFLRSLGLTSDVIARVEPIPETRAMIESYRQVCREGHWLEALGALGPGTECVVPTLYSPILQGIQRSGAVAQGDYVFWSIHVYCDDGHGANIIEALKPYATTAENQQRIAHGAMRVLDARAAWLDGLERHVFQTATGGVQHD